MSSIFISYRRADSGGYAGRIFDRLCEEFGQHRVFRDVDTIAGGTRFRDEIVRQLDTCKVVLVVIGPTWVDARDQTNSRRLENAADWVRIEVATALAHNVCVIPVTVGGATFPSASDLPDDLKGLVQLQGRDLRDGDTWEHDLQLLVQRVASELGVYRPPIRRTAFASIVALAVILATGGFYFWRSRISQPVPPVTTPLVQQTSTPKSVPISVAGKWTTGQLTNQYAENEKFSLAFEFDQSGDKLSGTVQDSGEIFGIFDGKISGNVITFYIKSEVTDGDETKPYKEFYDGTVTDDQIQFRRQDDLSNGGIPLKFVATRFPMTDAKGR